MAASFPCPKASTPQEKAICADANLSALDEQLAGAYDSMRKQLSPASAAEIQADQREWLKWLRATCPSKDGTEIASCLQSKYNERLKDLQTGVLRLGGMAFFQRLKVLVMPDAGPPEPGSLDPGFGLGRFTWPELDHPTAQQATWNAAMRAQVLQLSGGPKPRADFSPDMVAGGDENVGYAVTAANDKMIAVNLKLYWYGYGAPHGNDVSISFLWLVQQQRPLETADIFSGSDWVQLLTSRSYQQLRQSSEADSLYEEGKAHAADAVRNPANWTLDPTQLEIAFPVYSVAPRSAGVLSVTFGWAELKPYLTDGFDPAGLPAQRKGQ